MALLIIMVIVGVAILAFMLHTRRSAYIPSSSLPFETPFKTRTSRNGYILDECFAQDVDAVMSSTLLNRDKGHGQLCARKDGIVFISEKHRGETFHSPGYKGLHAFIEHAPGVGCFLVLRSPSLSKRFQLGKMAAANMMTIINYMREQG